MTEMFFCRSGFIFGNTYRASSGLGRPARLSQRYSIFAQIYCSLLL
jgi:hypothetical protein